MPDLDPVVQETSFKNILGSLMVSWYLRESNKLKEKRVNRKHSPFFSPQNNVFSVN